MFTILSAGWCPYCNRMKPEIEALEKAGWTVSKYPDESGQIVLVDCEDKLVEALVVAHKVEAFPTLIRFDQGKELRRHAGYLDRWGVGTLYRGRNVTPQRPKG